MHKQVELQEGGSRSSTNGNKEYQSWEKKVELRVSKDNILEAGLLVLKTFQVTTIKQTQKVLMLGQVHNTAQYNQLINMVKEQRKQSSTIASM
ncbi:hypothetical protein A2U01_0011297 [Trifolium medium]|uniref:Uncharacterized protein n=1 Tax=Trifolium medium TaxID=97028 RepID=A0A392MSY8_9FABA|nr:hypothetical protein [Trifolium medium]